MGGWAVVHEPPVPGNLGQVVHEPPLPGNLGQVAQEKWPLLRACAERRRNNSALGGARVQDIVPTTGHPLLLQ